MIWASEFVTLDKSINDRASFDSGEAELNTFIKTQASRHMDVGISKTLVLPSSKPSSKGKYIICAFYSVAPGSIKRNSFPKELSKKMPH